MCFHVFLQLLPFSPGEDPKDRLVEVLWLVCEHVMTRSSDHLTRTNTQTLMFWGKKDISDTYLSVAVEVKNMIILYHLRKCGEVLRFRLISVKLTESEPNCGYGSHLGSGRTQKLMATSLVHEIFLLTGRHKHTQKQEET